jgi:glycogen debranching enzyme
MAGLDNIPTKQTVEIETVKLDETLLKEITDLNAELNGIVSRFGEIFLRRKDIHTELESLDKMTESFEDEFKAKNSQMRDILDSLDDKYPQGRLNLQEGTITFQPGAPSRKQLQQPSQQVSSASSGMKVVKE